MQNFRGKTIDEIVIGLAQDYANRLAKALGDGLDNMSAGTAAASECSVGKKLRECEIRIVPGEPITGVTGLRGGQTRFDKLVLVGGIELWIEFQSSDYGGARKDAQLQGQLIALGESIVTESPRAFFYKILGKERKILRWSRSEAKAAIQSGDFDAPHVYRF